ncbi:hypothetical protein J2X11_001730 [Aeromicrobium panaciterrae]|uniref:Polyketide cyclase n=1 Tax=Aeromicrobium panaciterrae TaxID=363861 RepID=A0ABU1UNY3_9ACTN|nr:hypothetical protein [Aeromicrobium panaciterrae]MDR7086891.1 hypothetical protein [Aeromicrobium panaciterrae]
MNSNYEFHSRWQVVRSREALWDELEALLASDDPMVWWGPVEVVEYDGTNLSVRAASHFGYRLAFELKNLQLTRPDRLTFESAGDLRGEGAVTFIDGTNGRSSTMEIDWRVATDRRWMRWTGWVLRPVFVAGHHLIMRQGEKNLNAWLEAR